MIHKIKAALQGLVPPEMTSLAAHTLGGRCTTDAYGNVQLQHQGAQYPLKEGVARWLATDGAKCALPQDPLSKSMRDLEALREQHAGDPVIPGRNSIEKALFAVGARAAVYDAHRQQDARNAVHLSDDQKREAMQNLGAEFDARDGRAPAR